MKLEGDDLGHIPSISEGNPERNRRTLGLGYLQELPNGFHSEIHKDPPQGFPSGNFKEVKGGILKDTERNP